MEYRRFTIEEVEDLLPWLRTQLDLLAATQVTLIALENDKHQLMAKTISNGTSNTDSRLSENQKSIADVSDTLGQTADRITSEGVIIRDNSTGLVDFPSVRDGTEVYLCWYRSEESLLYWHPLDTGVSGRQPI